MGINTQPLPLDRNTILPFPSHCPNDFLIMPPKSRASAGRLRLSLGIHDRGMVTASPCDFCVLHGLDCVKMPGDEKLKCAECTHRGKPCVSLSWASLDISRDNLREGLVVAEAERDALLERLSEAQASVVRKQKVLEQVEGRTQKKLRCLVEEMEAEGEDLSATVIDASALQAKLFGPAPVDTAAAGAGSSQGS